MGRTRSHDWKVSDYSHHRPVRDYICAQIYVSYYCRFVAFAHFVCVVLCCCSRYNAKVDIWSIGCIVIELATAKEPWAEKNFESSFAALYYIATKKTELPFIPSTLSEAGHDFIRLWSDARHRQAAYSAAAARSSLCE